MLTKNRLIDCRQCVTMRLEGAPVDRAGAVMKHTSKARPRYIPASIAVEFLRRAESTGDSLDELVRRSRVPYSLSALRTGKVPELTRAEFAALYRECMLALERHASRQDGRDIVKVSEFHMMCYCIINCATLGEAIQRAVEFCRMIGDRVAEFELIERSGMAEFYMNFKNHTRTPSAFLIDLQGLSNLYRLFSWLIGNAIPLQTVEIAYSESMREAMVIEMFPVPVRLEAEKNKISFSVDYLRRPIVKTYSHLVELLKLFPHDLMPPDYCTEGIAEHVKVVFNIAIMKRQTLPTVERLAQLFGHSSTTFRRRLAEENTSVSKLRNECLKELATVMMRRTADTNEQIARRLGFSDADSFRRAFRKWTSLAPSEYRRRLS